MITFRWQYSSLTGRTAGAYALAKAIEESKPSKTTTILDVCAGTGIAGEQVSDFIRL